MLSFRITWGKSGIECFFMIFDSRSIILGLIGRNLSLQMFWNERVFERAFLLRIIRIDCEAFNPISWWDLSRVRLRQWGILMMIYVLIISFLFRILIISGIIHLNEFFNGLQHIGCKLKQLFSFVLLCINLNCWGMIR